MRPLALLLLLTLGACQASNGAGPYVGGSIGGNGRSTALH